MFLRISIVLTGLLLLGASLCSWHTGTKYITAETPAIRSAQEMVQIRHAIELLSSPERRARSLALDALAVLHAKEAVPDIIKLLSHPDAEIRFTAVNAICNLEARETTPNIIGLLSDSDSIVREAAICVLFVWEVKEATPDITKLLSDPDKEVRKLACDVLKSLGAEVPEEKQGGDKK